jgi:hypothetical protein
MCFYLRIFIRHWHLIFFKCLVVLYRPLAGLLPCKVVVLGSKYLFYIIVIWVFRYCYIACALGSHSQFAPNSIFTKSHSFPLFQQPSEIFLLSETSCSNKSNYNCRISWYRWRKFTSPPSFTPIFLLVPTYFLLAIYILNTLWFSFYFSFNLFSFICSFILIAQYSLCLQICKPLTIKHLLIWNMM